MFLCGFPLKQKNRNVQKISRMRAISEIMRIDGDRDERVERENFLFEA